MVVASEHSSPALAKGCTGLKNSSNHFFLNSSEILLISSGLLAEDVGDDILFLQDHCRLKVRFDPSGDRKSKIIEW